MTIDSFHKLLARDGNPHILSNEVKNPTSSLLDRMSNISKLRQVLILSVFCDIFVLTAYVWFVSIGTFTNWPTIPYYNNYDQLATAFRAGQLSILIKPDPALVTLANPYDPSERKGIHFPSDISLYKGKFYFYFGPTPAVILLVAKAIFPGVIGDQYLVFAFISGIFLVGSLFIIKIWRRFFPDVSLWKVGCSLLVIGLIGPYCWTLGIPLIYNAAIMGGQFFFFAGLYMAFDALDRDTVSIQKLAVTGVFWSAALGSRITQIFPIIFMSVMILVWIIKKYRKAGILSKSIQPVLIYGLILGLGAAAIGCYNWARFSSVFETGIMYQLTGIDLQKYRSFLLSPVYIIQNLYNYLLFPPKLIYSFPWFRTVNGLSQSILPVLSIPTIYTSQQIVGLLYSDPFVLFAIIPISMIILRRPISLQGGEDQRSFNWFILALLGSFLSMFTFFLIFFFSAERYLGDFLPPLLLLSVIGFWQLGRSVASRSILRVFYVLTAVMLVTISLIISNLLALDIHNAGFKALNPLLWRQLSNFFRP